MCMNAWVAGLSIVGMSVWGRMKLKKESITTTFLTSIVRVRRKWRQFIHRQHPHHVDLPAPTTTRSRPHSLKPHSGRHTTRRDERDGGYRQGRDQLAEVYIFR